MKFNINQTPLKAALCGVSILALSLSSCEKQVEQAKEPVRYYDMNTGGG